MTALRRISTLSVSSTIARLPFCRSRRGDVAEHEGDGGEQVSRIDADRRSLLAAQPLDGEPDVRLAFALLGGDRDGALHAIEPHIEVGSHHSAFLLIGASSAGLWVVSLCCSECRITSRPRRPG